MDITFKIAACGIIAVLLTTTIKSTNKELALALTLGTCAILLITGIQALNPIETFINELRKKTGLESAVFTPLLRVCVIGLTTQLSVYFCQDAGECTIAKVLEICGIIASVGATIPLLNLVLEAVNNFLGA